MDAIEAFVQPNQHLDRLFFTKEAQASSNGWTEHIVDVRHRVFEGSL